VNFFDHSLHQDLINKEQKNGHHSHFHPTFAKTHPESHRSDRLAGSELAPPDFVALEARWIDRELATAARLRRVDSFTGAEMVGRKGGGDYSGIAIPYFLPGATEIREHRLRRDHPEMEADGQGRVKLRQKYLSPPSRQHALLPAGRKRRAASGCHTARNHHRR
jgi:hypothetical protein